MKTAYLNLRITPDDKKLLSDLAWKRRMSMSEMVALLIRRAAADELGQQMEALKQEVAAAAPTRTSVKLNDIAAAPEYMPGESPDCSPSCRWFHNGDCTHPDYKDTWDTETITGDCTRYEPKPRD